MKTLKVNYLGKKYLEQCNKISIKSIMKIVEEKLKNELLELELEWIEIIKTKANYWWFRIWFKCPRCSSRCFNLYNVNWELICRKCSWLKYKKQVYKGMLEEKIIKK